MLLADLPSVFEPSNLMAKEIRFGLHSNAQTCDNGSSTVRVCMSDAHSLSGSLPKDGFVVKVEPSLPYRLQDSQTVHHTRMMFWPSEFPFFAFSPKMRYVLAPTDCKRGQKRWEGVDEKGWKSPFTVSLLSDDRKSVLNNICWLIRHCAGQGDGNSGEGLFTSRIPSLATRTLWGPTVELRECLIEGLCPSSHATKEEEGWM